MAIGLPFAAVEVGAGMANQFLAWMGAGVVAAGVSAAAVAGAGAAVADDGSADGGGGTTTSDTSKTSDGQGDSSTKPPDNPTVDEEKLTAGGEATNKLPVAVPTMTATRSVRNASSLGYLGYTSIFDRHQSKRSRRPAGRRTSKPSAPRRTMRRITPTRWPTKRTR